MTTGTSTEQYTKALQYAHMYIDRDNLSLAVAFLDAARVVSHDLEIEATMNYNL